MVGKRKLLAEMHKDHATPNAFFQVLTATLLNNKNTSGYTYFWIYVLLTTNVVLSLLDIRTSDNKCGSGTVRSGTVQSSPVRYSPVRSGPVWFFHFWILS